MDWFFSHDSVLFGSCNFPSRISCSRNRWNPLSTSKFAQRGNLLYIFCARALDNRHIRTFCRKNLLASLLNIDDLFKFCNLSFLISVMTHHWWGMILFNFIQFYYFNPPALMYVNFIKGLLRYVICDKTLTKQDYRKYVILVFIK